MNNHTESNKSATQFNLSNRFALFSLVVIAAVSLATSMLLSRFLAKEMLFRDAQVSMQFIQNSVVQKNAGAYFFGRDAVLTEKQQVEDFLKSINSMPDVIRSQLYSMGGAVLWSSQSAAIDRVFTDNPELNRALTGELTIEADLIKSRNYMKPEHVFSAVPANQFAEYYIPIWNAGHTQVIGAAELYKSPNALFGSIAAGLRLIWACGVFGGLLIYATLFWLVRRGHRLIEEQQKRIASNEGFAALGEVAAAVAHNIRNPLSSIRSTAELLNHEDLTVVRKHGFANDIIAEVDRLEVWIRGLLNYAQTDTRKPRSTQVNHVIGDMVDGVRDEIVSQNIQLVWQLDPTLPKMSVDALLLEQIVLTLTANAIDAMPNGGTLKIGSYPTIDQAGAPCNAIFVDDTGVGIPAEQLRTTFAAPRSTKPHGLGIGLPLVHRSVKRIGGAIFVQSQMLQGTRVTIRFPLSVPGEGA